MSFIGNKPDSYGYSTTSYENFNGDGVTTTFTLSKTVTSSSDIQVVVNNVIQEPEVAYYVTNLTSLVFTSAPSAGTDNIYIVYRNFINTRFAFTVPDNTISSQSIIPNSIVNSSLSNSSITINGTEISLGSSGSITAGATITDDTSTNATRYVMLGSATSGAYTSANVSSTKLTFNPSTGLLSTTGFSGAGTGLTGTASGLTSNVANYGTITNATSGTYYPQLVSADSGTLAAYANNAFVFDAGTGSLGIGMTPLGGAFSGGALQVYASSFKSYGTFDCETAGWGYLTFSSGSNIYGYIGPDVNTIGEMGVASVGDLVFSTGYVERLRIDDSGNVGIGTSSPGAKLQCNTSAGAVSAIFTDATYSTLKISHADTSGNIAFLNGANQNYAVFGSSSIFYASGTEQARITSNGLGIGYTSLTGLGSNGLAVAGNVGIGTSSPGYKLQVAGDCSLYTSNDSSGETYLRLGSSLSMPQGAAYIAGIKTAVGYGYLSFATAASGVLSSKMTLDSSGNLGLGVTPSAWSTFKALQLPATTLFGYDGGTNNRQTNLGNNVYYDGLGYKYVATDAASYQKQVNGQHIWYTAPSGTAGNTISFTQAMTLSSGGNLTIAGTLTETSSITLKENVNPIENALSSILLLNGKIYDRKDGSNKNEAGLIAEEVVNVIPNIVSKDENGNPVGIHYTKLTAYLIEAIKELKQEIEELKK